MNLRSRVVLLSPESELLDQISTPSNNRRRCLADRFLYNRSTISKSTNTRKPRANAKCSTCVRIYCSAGPPPLVKRMFTNLLTIASSTLPGVPCTSGEVGSHACHTEGRNGGKDGGRESVGGGHVVGIPLRKPQTCPGREPRVKTIRMNITAPAASLTARANTGRKVNVVRVVAGHAPSLAPSPS